MRRVALRTLQTHLAYEKAEKNPNFMAEAPSLQDFTFWRVIDNTYPHDIIATTHHMLVPKRKFAEEDDMTESEAEELSIIKSQLAYKYDSIQMNFPRNRTIPDWLHYHLYIYRELEVQ